MMRMILNCLALCLIVLSQANAAITFNIPLPEANAPQQEDANTGENVALPEIETAEITTTELTTEGNAILPSNAMALRPAETSCNAAYSAPCGRTNSIWLATTTAATLEEDNLVLGFSRITAGEFNMETGFYPFVFDTVTGICVAHGSNATFVGKTLHEIYEHVGITYAESEALLVSLGRAAANPEGGWVQYLWSDNDLVNSKLAFVLNVKDHSPSTTTKQSNTEARFALGVGYENTPLPPDLPCNHMYDSWCSLTNVRSLVGKAQFKLTQTESLAAFEQAAFEVSFDDYYKVPGGFYLFMYHYDGRLKSHGVLRDSFSLTLAGIVEGKKIGTWEEGEALHQKFIQAAEDQDTGAWVQYNWRNSLDEATYLKVAYIIKIEFEGEEYYLGTGYTFAMEEQDREVYCADDFNLPCSFRTAASLASHGLSHAITSPLSVTDMYEQVTYSDEFKFDDYYLFIYDFNETCVAHGLKSNFVGLTLSEIFDTIQIPLNATALHEHFKSAAAAGGGWVVYDWLIPDVPNSEFQKISYLFRINLNGRSYYGGVGFNNKRAPIQSHLELGTKRNGEPIDCTREYALPCTEINAPAILGEAMAQLILGSSMSWVTTTEGDSREESSVRALDDVLQAITDGDEAFRTNDFYVSVFAVDGNDDGCESDTKGDGNSGCCIAHGANKAYVGKSWQQILDMENITSILGTGLHSRLVEQSNRGGDSSIILPWLGETTKNAWASRYHNNGKTYYVVVDTINALNPATCDDCPSDMECTEDDQAFCSVPINYNYLGGMLIYGWALGVLIILMSVGFAAWTSWNRNHRVVRASQPFFLIMICVGVLVMGSAMFPMAIDDSMTSAEGASMACMSMPWLLALGWTMVFSALFAKLWRLNQVVDSAKTFRRIQVNNHDVLWPFGILFTCNVVLLTIWTILDPLYYKRNWESDVESYGTCTADGDHVVWKVMLSLLLIVNFMALIMANYQAYKARNLSTEHAESSYIAAIMGSYLQVMLLGTPVLVLVADNPAAQFFIQTTMLFFLCSAVLLLMFVPKVIAWYRPQPTSRGSMQNRWSAISGLNQSGADLASRVSGLHSSFQNETAVTGVRSSFTNEQGSREFIVCTSDVSRELKVARELPRNQSCKSLMSQVSLPPEIVENAIDARTRESSVTFAPSAQRQSVFSIDDVSRWCQPPPPVPKKMTDESENDAADDAADDAV